MFPCISTASPLDRHAYVEFNLCDDRLLCFHAILVSVSTFLDKNRRRVQQKINKTHDYIALLIYPRRHLALDDYDFSE